MARRVLAATDLHLDFGFDARFSVGPGALGVANTGSLQFCGLWPDDRIREKVSHGRCVANEGGLDPLAAGTRLRS